MPVPPRRSRWIALSVLASTRRPPNRFAALGALRSGLAHARNHAFGKPLGLLLGHGGEHRQQDPADHLVIGTEVRLGVAMEVHAVGVQPLEMMDRRHHALAAKAVERPEHHAIELAAAGVLQQGGKLLALARALAAAHAVNVFADNVAARIGAPGAQVAELVLRVLAFGGLCRSHRPKGHSRRWKRFEGKESRTEISGSVR